MREYGNAKTRVADFLRGIGNIYFLKAGGGGGGILLHAIFSVGNFTVENSHFSGRRRATRGEEESCFVKVTIIINNLRSGRRRKIEKKKERKKNVHAARH